MLLEPILPQRRKNARIDDRKIISAIFYVLRTGTPWRDLPEHYGPYTTAYNRFNRWCRRGIWAKFLNKLASKPQAELISFGQHLLESDLPTLHRRRSPKNPLVGVVRCGGRATAHIHSKAARPAGLRPLDRSIKVAWPPH
jgi:hypothetical protein